MLIIISLSPEDLTRVVAAKTKTATRLSRGCGILNLAFFYDFILRTRLARRRYSPVAVIKGEAKSRCVHTELMDYA